MILKQVEGEICKENILLSTINQSLMPEEDPFFVLKEMNFTCWHIK